MYCICKNGAALMPVTTEGVTTDDGLIEVISRQGTVYTVNPGHLVSAEEAGAMLRHKRAEELAAEGYDVKLRADGSYRVFQPKKHGAQGGYFVTETSCTCPDFEKRGGQPCKHVLGLPQLIRIVAMNKKAQKATAALAAAPIGSAIRVKPSAKLAAMIAHDGWGE